MAAGSGLVRGGASYSYQKGPDGRDYAVGGEVSIDVSSEKDPAATLAKMARVQAAALAPAEPSSQDRSVAAQAQATAAQARVEMTQKQDGASPGTDATKKPDETPEAYSINTENSQNSKQAFAAAAYQKNVKPALDSINAAIGSMLNLAA